MRIFVEVVLHSDVVHLTADMTEVYAKLVADNLPILEEDPYSESNQFSYESIGHLEKSMIYFYNTGWQECI